MTADIRKLIATESFSPFVVHTADRGVLRVPTVDHIAVPPAGVRVFVFSDDDTHEVLSPLLIARLNVEHLEPVSLRDA